MCNQDIENNEDTCKYFLYMNYYIKCIISSNIHQYKRVKSCIYKYGNKLYSKNSTLQNKHINFKYCDDFNSNDYFSNEYNITKDVYYCFLNSHNLNYKYEDIDCKKFKIIK